MGAGLEGLLEGVLEVLEGAGGGARESSCPVTLAGRASRLSSVLLAFLNQILQC